MPDEFETHTAPRLISRTLTSVRKKRLVLPALISLAFLLTVSYVARPHTFGAYATETDFYHLYAPDAERIANWRFPENPYQGPGYPVLLALVGKLTGDLFTAGKWISLLSAALVVMLTFLLFERLFGYWIGICSQLIISVSNQFPKYSMNATTDVPFLMLCLAALVLFIMKRWMCAGASC